MGDFEQVTKRFQRNVAALAPELSPPRLAGPVSNSLASSGGLSGIVSSDYTSAQQEIEKILVRNVNDIMGSKGMKIERISEIIPLIQYLIDSADTAERKLRIANDKIVDLELSGVAVHIEGSDSLHSVQILHSQLQRREGDLAHAIEEIEQLKELLETARDQERNALAIANAERDRLAFLISSKDDTVSELEHIVNDLRSKIKKSQTEVANKQRELDELRSELTNASAISQAEFQAVTRDKDGTIKQLELQLEQLAQDVARRQQEQSKREVELEKQLVRMRAERTGGAVGSIVSIQDKVEMSVMQDECARQRRKISELETAANRNRLEMENMRSRVKEVEEINERTTESKNGVIRHLEEQNQEILQRLSVLGAEKKALEKNRDEFANTVEKLNSDTELLQDIMATIRTQSEQTSADNSRLKFKLESKEREIARLRDIAQESTLKNAKTQLEAAEMNALTAKAERDRIQAKLEDTERKVSELSSALASTVAERAVVTQLSESALGAEHKRTAQLERKILTLEQELSLSQLTRDALESEVKAIQAELVQRQRIAESSEANIVNEIFSAVNAVKEEFTKKLQESTNLIAEKEKAIEELRLKLKQETPVIAPAILVEDDAAHGTSGISDRQELDIAYAELRALIHGAGWPIDNGAEDIGNLISVVKANVSAIEEFYTNQLREMELDVDFLRSQVEGERMRLEDANQSLKRDLDNELGKRKVLQDSALELAEKTTEIWNKYRAAGGSGPQTTLTLPPFPRNF